MVETNVPSKSSHTSTIKFSDSPTKQLFSPFYDIIVIFHSTNRDLKYPGRLFKLLTTFACTMVHCAEIVFCTEERAKNFVSEIIFTAFIRRSMESDVVETNESSKAQLS